jgi:transcriptional antiterminator RfaH
MKNWYIIITKPNCEKKLHKFLTNKKLETYIPLKTERRIWSDRIKKMSTPMLKNYLFINCLDKERLLVFESGYALKYLSEKNIPCFLSEKEINLIRTIEQHGTIYSNDYSTFEIGKKIRVKAGDLKGIEGTIISKEKEHFIKIELPKLNATIALDVKNILLEYI